MNQWHGCYDGSWRGIIVPEAFSHPAKMSYSLTKRIFKHALSEGWLKKGDVVVDPFGGIGSTGIIGAYEGINVLCYELEMKFCKLAMENFNLHGHKLKKLGLPRPQIIQGDSRKLSEVIAGADCLIASPPFTGIVATQDPNFLTPGEQGKVNPSKSNRPNYGQTPGQLGSMKQGDIDCVVGSQPYIKGLGHGGKPTRGEGRTDDTNLDAIQDGYGQSPGQLGSMKPDSVDAVVSSPPYAEQQEGGGIAKSVKGESDYPLSGGPSRTKKAKRAAKGFGYQNQADTPGNLGNIKPGSVEPIINNKSKIINGQVDGIISSPPFEESLPSGDTSSSFKAKYPDSQTGGDWGQRYGSTTGNIGNDKGETFWQAARQIVSECHKILKPGGYAIWVVKAFVRKGRIVDFPGDWRRLCESQGFVTVHEHHAMLVKETRHDGLFGQTIIDRKEKKSFFRRLTDRKAAENSYWEYLDEQEHTKWIEYATDKAWSWYDSLTEDQKTELIIEDQEDSGLKCPVPTEASILGDAKAYALDMDDEDPNDWNEHIRIDYEVVLCTRRNE